MTAKTSAHTFGEFARVLSARAHGAGLRPPGFRTPPKMRGRQRTVRRFSDGSALVSVAISGRSEQDVFADMVEGVVVANALRGQSAGVARLTLSTVLPTHEVLHAA